MPPEHVGVALAPPTHTAPHRPQFITLVVVGASQPLPLDPSQSPYPALQVMPQAPAEQLGVALAAVGHALPQVPQLPASLWSA